MEFPAGPAESGMDLFKIFFTDPFPFLQKCFQTYGDLFTLELGNFGVTEYDASGKWVFISNPAHIRQLLTVDSGSFLAGPANDIQFQQLVPRGGILIIDGEPHIERRRIISRLLQGEKKIRGFTAAMCNTVEAEIERFPAKGDFKLAPILRRISNEVMQHLVFGAEVDGDTAYVSDKLSGFGDLSVVQADKVAMVKDCCEVLATKVSRHRGCPVSGHGEESSIFSLLLNAEDSRGPLTDEVIRAELLLLLLGGTDTTSTTMSWILAWILSNPEIRRNVEDEIARTLSGGVMDSTTIDRLVYLDMVIAEACRISPVLFNSSARLLTKNLRLGNYSIPAGTIMAVCSYLAHMRPDNYSEPEQFNPERFRGSKPDPYKWVPFGGGVRRCLGMAFALYEMKVVIATILSRTRLEPVDVRTEPELQGSFFAPAGSVRVRLSA
jgi:cytochrome P450 family 110